MGFTRTSSAALNDCDSVVWNHESKGKYLGSVSVCGYEFESFTPVYTPATWDIKIPHRVKGDVQKILLVCFVVNIRLCIIYSSLVV